MTRMFENSANGHKERIGVGDSICVFLFGGIYLASKGLWRDVFIWMIAVIPASIATGGPGLILFMPFAGLIYACCIQNMLAKDYLRKGWKEIAINTPNMIYDTKSGGYREVAKIEDPKTKNCPFCAEPVLFAAIKCKHCGSELNKK